MKLELKQLSLKDFKGIKEKTITLGTESFIYGKNGSGKTTLLDAFLWLMFGKDHLGRADFRIKPYDKTGKTIERPEVSVEAKMLVDGQEVLLRRTYIEEWVKPKTEEYEVLKGHTTKYFIADVSVKKSEFESFVAGICDEAVFKAITNPSYFPNLDKKQQREMLFSFIELTDEEVAGDNEGFKDLLKEVTGIGFENFRKDIANKKARINLEIKGLPDRIAGLKEGMPELPDEAAITAQIVEKQERLTAIEEALNDVAKNMSQQNEKRMAIQSKINELQLEIGELKNSYSLTAQDEIHKKQLQIGRIEQAITEVGAKKKVQENRRSRLMAELNEAKAKVETLRAEWVSINAEKLIFPEGAFTCPTCGRLLEVEDIEAKQRQLTENFNRDKAARLDKNKFAGSALIERISEIEEALKNIEEVEDVSALERTRIEALKNEIAKLEQEKEAYKSSEKYAELNSEIARQQEELNSLSGVVETSNYHEEKKALIAEIDTLKSKIALKDVVANTKKLIAEHEKRKKALNQELASLEKKEYTLKRFEFEKNTEYENRINKMFELVKFRLFHTQVDGQIVPDFECMVDGVPYSTLNNAMQVNAGLDIIKTLSRINNAYAPIWIDNREGVTNILKMDTQVISLLVSPEEENLVVVEK